VAVTWVHPGVCLHRIRRPGIEQGEVRPADSARSEWHHEHDQEAQDEDWTKHSVSKDKAAP